MRKLVLLLLLLCLALPAQAQESIPPRGFFIALADLNIRIGQNIRLVCSDANDGSSCKMSNVGLNWGWELLQYADAGLDCPEAGQFYTQGTISAYRYFFIWENINYEYRQYAFGGDPAFLCATSTAGNVRLKVDAQALANPSTIANPNEIIPSVTPNLPTLAPAAPLTSTCTLPPRLSINQPARVTPGLPNNLRSQAGLNQPLIAQIPGETQIQILGGPVCADGINWWQIQLNAQIGWTGEGQNADYWLEPLPTAAPPTATNLVIPTTTPVISTSNAAQLQKFTTLSAASPIVWSGYGLMALSSPDLNTNQALLIYDTGTTQTPPRRLDIGGTVLDAAFNPFFDPNRPTLAVLAAINAVGTSNRVLQFWQPFTGQEQFSVNVAVDAHHLAFSPDGKTVAVASGEAIPSPTTTHKIVLWDAQTTQPIGELAHEGYISDLAFSPDGNTLASGNGKQLILWDMTTLSRAAVLEANLNPFLSAIAFSFDRKYLAVSATETDANNVLLRTYVGLWDVATQTEIQQFPAETSINHLDFSPDSTLLAVSQAGLQALSGAENTKIWNITDFNTPAVILPPEGQVYVGNASFSDDGRFLAVYQGGAPNQVLIYTVPQ